MFDVRIFRIEHRTSTSNVQSRTKKRAAVKKHAPSAYTAFTMSRKSQIRQLALQMLFLFDAHGGADRELARQAAQETGEAPADRERAIELATGAWNTRETIDPWAQRIDPPWPPRRN